MLESFLKLSDLHSNSPPSVWHMKCIQPLAVLTDFRDGTIW